MDGLGKGSLRGVARLPEAKPVPSGADGNTVDRYRLKPLQREVVRPTRELAGIQNGNPRLINKTLRITKVRAMKKSSKLFEALLVAALCLAMTSSIVWCASGDLDPSFGNGGKFLLAHGDFRAVAFDRNTGAIISVGTRDSKQFLVRTFVGQLDSEFGNGGVVVNPVTHSGVGLVILSDSRIVTAGSERNRISLNR